MNTTSYSEQRARIEHYFDRTAARAWERLTSDAPVSRIRATVRAGRDEMQNTLLGWLPMDLSGRRILDAGCGTGSFVIEAARRGAQVTGVEISARLVDIARERTRAAGVADRVTLLCGDMAQTDEQFDHVVAMDSIIHYEADAMHGIIAGLRARATHSVLFTVAPRTPLLGAMLAVGQLFPRSDRSPAIMPVNIARMTERLRNIDGWQVRRTYRVQRGFYTSQALELAS